MVDGTHRLGVLRRELVCERAGTVAAAVIDADDLETLGEGGQDLERLGDQSLDVLRLVVRREEVAQLGHARPGRRPVG